MDRNSTRTANVEGNRKSLTGQPNHNVGSSNAEALESGLFSSKYDNSGFYFHYGKRALDLVASFAGLVLLSPLLLLCAVLVRLTSRGPVLFRQVRVGRYGRCFRVFKFRTMHDGAERMGASVVVPGDPRLAPVANLLRRTKLDELPQLLNVLLGDMSLVGPRPRVPEEVELERPEERALLRLRPGMTSYASLYHRMEADFCSKCDDPAAVHRAVIIPQKSSLDIDYFENLSLSLDLRLILLTIMLVFVPGRAQPRTLRVFGLEVLSYGRFAQMAVDTLIFGSALWLAYWLRYEGHLSEFSRFQMGAFIVLIPMVRLAVNSVFGIYQMIWRYVNLLDAIFLAMSLTVVSVVLLLLRLFLPVGIYETHFFQLPLSVITMEYLLAMGGCLGLRALRRSLYELDHRYRPLPGSQRRRVLIAGAGLPGLGLALEMKRLPQFEVVGFVDDDGTKEGCTIAGYKVLGTSDMLSDLLTRFKVDDLIVCSSSVSTPALEKLRSDCENSGVNIQNVPTLDQILALPPRLSSKGKAAGTEARLGTASR